MSMEVEIYKHRQVDREREAGRVVRKGGWRSILKKGQRLIIEK